MIQGGYGDRPEGAGRPGGKGQESSGMPWSFSFSHFFVATCLMQVTIISTWILAVAWPPHIYYDSVQSQLYSVASNLFETDTESDHSLLEVCNHP